MPERPKVAPRSEHRDGATCLIGDGAGFSGNAAAVPETVACKSAKGYEPAREDSSNSARSWGTIGAQNGRSDQKLLILFA